MMCRPIALAAALVLILPSAPALSADEPPPKRPNIILCMADDQGFGDVGYSGNPIPQTPNLDAMAAAGLRLDRFNTASPVCSPTRGSVLTGRHPNRFGCFSWGFELRPEEITVAKLLRDAGYATGHFGKWHLGSVRPDGPNNPGSAGFETWLSAPNFYENNPILSREGTAVPLEGESSMVTVEAALDFIDEATEADRPFLAVVWFGSPHTPHQATPETLEPYADMDLSDRLKHYYGEVTGIDRAMGRLRSALEDRGIADDTLVWYTSDNGPQNNGPGSTGGLRGRKSQLWEGGLRVPTILEWPAVIAEPRISELPSGTVDILPTLLDLAGVDYPDPDRPLDGLSLAPLILDDMDERPSPMGFWNPPSTGRLTPSAEIMAALLDAQCSGNPPPTELPPLPPEPAARLIATFEAGDPLPGHAAWIDGRYKLHRLPAPDDPSDVTLTLYDLSTDPTESNDLSADHPDLVSSLSAALTAWQASVVRSLRGDDDPRQ